MNKFRIICKLAKCGNIFAKLYEYLCRPLCWGPSLCWAGWPLAGSVSGSGSSPWPALMHCKYFKCYRSTSTFPTVRIRIRLKNFFYSKKEIHEWKFLLRNKTDLIRQNVLLTNFFVFDGHSYKSKFNKLLTNHNQNWGTFSVKKNPKKTSLWTITIITWNQPRHLCIVWRTYLLDHKTTPWTKPSHYSHILSIIVIY